MLVFSSPVILLGGKKKRLCYVHVELSTRVIVIKHPLAILTMKFIRYVLLAFDFLYLLCPSALLWYYECEK